MANGSPGTPEFNCEVPLILDTIYSAESPISDSGLPRSFGSPVLDPFAIGEGGRAIHPVILLGYPRR